ncbi:hypothetical protein [Rhodococcus sp. NPDC058521]|uniref:hypothetical protein n=1 Tax=Rhodococcus sp. NPDC058521 TaxID=3346536 RepID=UPI00365B9EAC
MVNDVEKRWSDRTTLRKAAIHAGAAIALALASMAAIIVWASVANEGTCEDAAFRICESPDRYLLAGVPTAILLVGGVSAFVRAYRAWKRGGTWPIWQGAGWILFILMLVYLFTFGGAAAAG